MNMETIIYDIETHPLLVAIAVMILGFVGYQYIKSQSAAAPATTAATTTNAPGGTGDVFNQTYNSYPTVVGQPVLATPPPIGNPVVHPPPVGKPPVVKPPVKTPPAPTAKYYKANKWPAPGSSLSSIASIKGTTVSHLMALNPSIKNPNLIYDNQEIRYA